MAAPAASMSDMPSDVVRQILAAVVHAMRLEHLNIIASDARSSDKYWRNLLTYLQLRGVCSGYVLCTSAS